MTVLHSFDDLPMTTKIAEPCSYVKQRFIIEVLMPRMNLMPVYNNALLHWDFMTMTWVLAAL